MSSFLILVASFAPKDVPVDKYPRHPELEVLCVVVCVLLLGAVFWATRTEGHANVKRAS